MILKKMLTIMINCGKIQFVCEYAYILALAKSGKGQSPKGGANNEKV